MARDTTHTGWLLDVTADEAVGFLMLAQAWQKMTGDV